MNRGRWGTKTGGKTGNRIPRVDKKGFRILTDDDDMFRLFDAGGQGSSTDDFGRLLEQMEDNPGQQRLLKQKHRVPSSTPPPSVAERIRQYPPPQLELDLHGCTGPQARAKATAFINWARLQGTRTVRIIVGKGLHSEGKAVLPDLVEALLTELKRSNVLLAFRWEKKDKRKSGSLIIYLMPQRENIR